MAAQLSYLCVQTNIHQSATIPSVVGVAERALFCATFCYFLLFWGRQPHQ